mmetsp:Transcript_89037/g.256702  ORF Transcript_89037/g.256702 Transcript_89037/m.256702 type:complete len:552 (+) Transcript_89037:3-1658(+)
MAPSMFLIPLSYSSIMGGLLTTIGTSTNLLVNGLLVQKGLQPFGIVEPGLVSLPVGLAGILFMVILGPKILPGNKGGLFRQVREHGDHLITALQVTAESRFVGMNVADTLDELGAHHASLLKLRRRGSQLPTAPNAQALGLTRIPSGEAEPNPNPERASQAQAARHIPIVCVEPQPSPEEATNPEAPADIERGGGLESLKTKLVSLDVTGNTTSLDVMLEIQPVPPHEQVKPGDVLLLSLPRDAVVSVTCKQERGVSVSSMNAMMALGESSEFVELVLGHASPLMGEPLERGPALVEQHYHCGMIALRRRDDMPYAQSFVAGDVILVLAPIGAAFPKKDFLVVTFVGVLPPPPRWSDLAPPILFVVGLVLSALDIVKIVQVSMALAVFFVLGGWVKAANIREIVDWQLLILIGSALGLAQGMQESGLADALARIVLAAPLPRPVAPTVLYVLVVVVTELVTNNAAAALGVPLAISLAKEMGLKSEKPLVGMVMFAASTSYACPIGYATNLMVKGPGGYNFWDFLKIGAPMDLLWIAGVSLVLPLVWPYEFV